MRPPPIWPNTWYSTALSLLYRRDFFLLFFLLSDARMVEFVVRAIQSSAHFGYLPHQARVNSTPNRGRNRGRKKTDFSDWPTLCGEKIFLPSFSFVFFSFVIIEAPTLSSRMPWIRQSSLPALRQYKYSGVDHSLISRYILKPFYAHVVLKLFPMRMA